MGNPRMVQSRHKTSLTAMADGNSSEVPVVDQTTIYLSCHQHTLLTICPLNGWKLYDPETTLSMITAEKEDESISSLPHIAASPNIAPSVEIQ
jgi:hypothetical protein